MDSKNSNNSFSGVLSLFYFLKNPKKILLSPFPKVSLWLKAWEVTKLVAFGVVMATIVGILTQFLAHIVGFDTTDNSLLLEQLKSLDAFSVFILIVFFGPFLEEISYRLFLTKNKVAFAIGLGFFLIFNLQIFLPFIIVNEIILSFVFLGIALVIVIAAIFLAIFMPDSWTDFVAEHFNFFFYLVSILFGLVHVANYTAPIQFFWLIPLLVLPQISISFVFGYLRVKFGSTWGAAVSFLAHSLYNFILGMVLFIPLIFLDFDQIITITDEVNRGNLITLTYYLNNSEQILLNLGIIFIFFVYVITFGIFIFTLIELIIKLKQIPDTKSNTQPINNHS